MLSFGFYVQVLLGEIYLLSMEIGKTQIAVFVVGEIKVSGKNYSIYSFKTLILSG